MRVYFGCFPFFFKIYKKGQSSLPDEGSIAHLATSKSFSQRKSVVNEI